MNDDSTRERPVRFAIKNRIIRWLNKQETGTLFTADTLLEALSEDGGQPPYRQLVTQNLSRMVALKIGVERKQQGIYVWNPARRTRGRTSPPVGPRAKSPEVPPLPIAGPGSNTAVDVPEAAAVPEPVPTPTPVVVDPPARASLTHVESEDRRTGPRFGDMFLLSYLAPLDGGDAFLAQSADDDRKIYRVSEVRS